MQPSGRGYDHGITTFSPDGRLFQVEYARESVKRGTTTAGLKFKEGVVLVCDKRIASRLIIPESIEKMFKIDEHVGVATSGLVADARQLVARARVESQINRITYADTVQSMSWSRKSVTSSNRLPNTADHVHLVQPYLSAAWMTKEFISTRPTLQVPTNPTMLEQLEATETPSSSTSKRIGRVE